MATKIVASEHVSMSWLRCTRPDCRALLSPSNVSRSYKDHLKSCKGTAPSGSTATGYSAAAPVQQAITSFTPTASQAQKALDHLSMFFFNNELAFLKIEDKDLRAS